MYASSVLKLGLSFPTTDVLLVILISIITKQVGNVKLVLMVEFMIIH